MSRVFIVASCKQWHKNFFETFKKKPQEAWYWVDSKEALTEAYQLYKPQFVFFLHWNWIVPKTILDSTECVCFHMTDVPYGRGGSPLQNLIVRGHKTTMLTALKMSEKLDAGPTYCKKPLSLDGRAEEIYLRAGALSWGIIRWIVDKNPIPIEQEGTPVIFARRTPQQSKIPSFDEASKLYDFIRMLDAEGYPKAFIENDTYRLEFSQATLGEQCIEANVKIYLRGNDE